MALKVYCKIPSTWSTCKIYYWEANNDEPTTTWTGEAMVDEGYNWYSYTFTAATSSNIVFNNDTAGNANQTADLSRTADGTYYFICEEQEVGDKWIGTWYNSDPGSWGSAISVAEPSFGATTHSLSPNAILSEISTPLATNHPFNPLFLGTTLNRIATHPFQLQFQPNGLYVCYPSYTNISTSITTQFLQNISLEATDTFASQKITAIDNTYKMSVTEKWTVDASHYMEAFVVKGMPYATMKYTDVTPIIKTQHAILSVNGGGIPGAVTATKFKVVLNNGQTWILYASSSIELTWGNYGGTWQLLASAAFTGTIRACYLGASADETVYDTYKTVYPTSCNVGVTFSGDSATMTYTYTTAGTGDLLMLALPHHVDMMTSPTTESLTLTSLKGDLTPIVGSTWTLTEDLTTIVWDSPTSPTASKEADIVTALGEETITAPTETDPYFYGKAIARLGRLSILCDRYGEDTLASTIRGTMKTSINAWFSGTNSNPLLYESTWGGICSTNGLADSSADFGNGWYNDHDFHYGYFIYAAACIAKEDATWLASYKDLVNDLLRDYANPSADDPYFTPFRNKDFFDFHSWSGGLFAFGDGNNQESTSEAINSYYGMYLWGVANDDNYIKNVGRLLLAMEIRAAKKYWHITNADDIYDSPFSLTKVVGILWATKVDYATWFGANVEYIHCIQMIPILPINEEYMTSDWITEEYPIVATALTREDPVLDDGWEGFIIAAQAVIDPANAWTNISSLSSYDGGNSKSNLLDWVATHSDVEDVTVNVNTQNITIATLESFARTSTVVNTSLLSTTFALPKIEVVLSPIWEEQLVEENDSWVDV